MIEFDVGGFHYKAEKLDAFQQADVVVALAPVVSGLADTAMAVLKKGGADWRGALSTLLDSKFAETAKPLADALAKTTRDDRHFVLTTCLGRVFRQQNGAWAPVVAPSGVILFAEVRDDLPTMMQLVWKVIEHSLLNFSSAPPAASS